MLEEELQLLLEFIHRLARGVNCPMYLKIIRIKGAPPGGFEAKVGDPQNVISSRDASDQINATIENFLSEYIGGSAFIRVDQTYLASDGEVIIAIQGNTDYSRLFALLGLYGLSNDVSFRNVMSNVGVDYFYFLAPDPRELLEFVLMGYPDLRKASWWAANYNIVAANSIALPKEDGGHIHVIATRLH